MRFFNFYYNKTNSKKYDRIQGMNYAAKNEITRNYYKKDFTKLNELMQRIRDSLATGNHLSLEGLDLSDIIEFKGNSQYFYIHIFQEFKQRIRYGSRRETLEETLNRAILGIRQNPRFNEFELQDVCKTRIMLEWITDRRKVSINKVHTHGEFDENRFEPGITGIEVKFENKTYVFLPTDCPVLNEMNMSPVFAILAKKIGLGKDKKLKVQEKAALVKNLEGAEFYLLESKAFVTYKTDILPLYRGNVLYKEFDYNTVINIFKKSNEWLINNMNEEGKFMYYYNPTLDDNIDHEHPTRKPPNLYYNDLRHAGGVISLLRMYELTKDIKYIEASKKAIKWTVGITKFHQDKEGKEAAYVFCNQKAKLGGVGIPLIMLMRYRNLTKDTTYDRYIEAYSRHILSRITEDGEFLGYYIHPLYHKGEPLENLSAQEKKEMFSFYYPGEVLMGLAMVANRYDGNNELVKEIIHKTKPAMRWIIDKRPEIYKELFTALPSDAWLMQAIEEWSNIDGFIEKNDIDFVFNDAKTMMQKMYKRDDTPYIDFEGGMYYEYGDHYYPDGARCEGLVAAYYLAKKLDMNELADEILASLKKAAKCQFQLYISEFNNFIHRNPKKSENSIRFKTVRQWVRVDSVQHVACFFIRLYWAENKSENANIIGMKGN